MRLTTEQIKATEQIFWPFVIVVGSKIRHTSIEVKRKFWRDNGIMSFLVVCPATILELFSFDWLPQSIYFILVAFGLVFYVLFIIKWRSYLSRIDVQDT